MRSFFKIVATVALISSAAAPSANADFLVDDFNVLQTVIQVGNGSQSGATQVVAGVLPNRTITVTVAAPPNFAAGSITTGPNPGKPGGLGETLTGTNSPVGPSNFDLHYTSPTAVDVTAGGTSGLFFTASSQGGATVTFTAVGNGGTAVASVTVPDAAPFNPYFVPFSAFGVNQSVLTALTSFDINSTFPNVTGSGPSLAFTAPIIFTSPNAVPEPGTIGMGAIAAIMAGGYGLRRRSRKVA